ncbi:MULTISPECIES: hypothetical protein [Sphingobium]|nr:hypothetical protein [Sphingobium sp. 15-1]
MAQVQNLTWMVGYVVIILIVDGAWNITNEKGSVALHGSSP